MDGFMDMGKNCHPYSQQRPNKKRQEKGYVPMFIAPNHTTEQNSRDETNKLYVGVKKI